MSEYVKNIQKIEDLWKKRIRLRDKGGRQIYISMDFVQVVRCRDCKHYYEVDEYHPQGNYVMRCCKYFDTFNDEVEPDGFCAWAERRSE